MMQVEPVPRAHCKECGCQLDWRSGACINVMCKVNQIDWDKPFVSEKPVRFPIREEMLADSRCARWQPLASLPTDRPVLIARQALRLGRWLLARHHPEDGPPYIYALPATHWAEDTVGSPVA